MTVDSSAPPQSASVRTIILGIDHSGRIVQHDRQAPAVLGRPAEKLLGASLSDLVIDPSPAENGDSNGVVPPPASAGDNVVQSLLDALKADREGTGMLSIRTESGDNLDAIVTVHPMKAGDANVAALALLRIPSPVAPRFVDPALMRQTLLDGTFKRIGDSLDFDHVARELITTLVPHFCNSGGVAVLESLIGDDEFPSHGLEGTEPLRRLAVANDAEDPAWEATFPIGEILRYPKGSPYVRCLDTGKPVLENRIPAADAEKLADMWQRPPVAGLLTDTSMLLLPLIAQGTTLGFFVCVRKPGYRAFDAYDQEIGMDFASRAAMFIDNARRYNREHATALTLQRSMLPTGLSAPSSVDVRHRYLPGSKLIEVGGDWYESIALPGARVALVVGDVAGHGVRAAVTMGRLRTAIHTLARLELPPAESLQQLDELMHTLGEREPHFATCTYAIFDAVSGTCEVAVAGHLPPLLVQPDGSNEYLDVSPAPPLGVGEGPIESKQFTVEDGSLFVLYTDGLVENRTRDIDDGLGRLQKIFSDSPAERSLEDLCKAMLDGVYADHQRDDIAVLLARLSRIPADHHATWTLGRELTSVGQARSLIREPMERWGLEDMIPITELLVSELVTNALRYSPGAVTLRIVREGALVCEVGDNSAALPRLRQAGRDDENGRGLQVVSQFASRWGARRTRTGKVVWCEQPLPGPEGEPHVLPLH
ncbi:MAG: SpoIIE family protein phosphatase [Actinobacteria bacterium]|nr:SpoIIE family protein phosphatase [Actinomycetota bacterium]